MWINYITVSLGGNLSKAVACLFHVFTHSDKNDLREIKELKEAKQSTSSSAGLKEIIFDFRWKKDLRVFWTSFLHHFTCNFINMRSVRTAPMCFQLKDNSSTE